MYSLWSCNLAIVFTSGENPNAEIFILRIYFMSLDGPNIIGLTLRPLRKNNFYFHMNYYLCKKMLEETYDSSMAFLNATQNGLESSTGVIFSFSPFSNVLTVILPPAS